MSDRRELSLLCRIELPAGQEARWRETALDVEQWSSTERDWTHYIRRAIADGELEEPLPGTVEGLLAYLHRPDSGFTVIRSPSHIEIAADRGASSEHDMLFVRGAVTCSLFEHAVEAGADAYLWLNGAGSVMADEFSHAHFAGRGGTLEVEEDEENTEYGDLAERFGDHLWRSNEGWTVAEDFA